MLQFAWIVISCSKFFRFMGLLLTFKWQIDIKRKTHFILTTLKICFLVKTISTVEHWNKDQKRKDLLHFIWYSPGNYSLNTKCQNAECRMPWYKYISTWLDSHKHYSDLKLKWIRLSTRILIALSLSFGFGIFGCVFGKQ